MARQTSKVRQNRRAGIVIGRASFQLLEPRLLFAGQTFDVTTYGANPNDTASDVAAITSAMNASGVGDTIYFPAGVYTISGYSNSGNDLGNGFIFKSDRIYLGAFNPTTHQNFSHFSGSDSKGPQIHIKGDNVTFKQLVFDRGGLYIDKSAGYNTNILIDNIEFILDSSGTNNNAITASSGLRNSTISNNLFTTNNYNYRGIFGIYGYGRDNLTVNNNLFDHMSAGIHMQSFGSGDSNAIFEQNWFYGMKGMGIELQQYGVNTKVQDNWYEHPNLSSQGAVDKNHDGDTNDPGENPNSNSMAYSIIMDESVGTLVRRNYIYAPERPDGIGTRIGVEIGGDNAIVEDNYMDWINAPVAANDGHGTMSVIVRNNYINHNREQIQSNAPLTPTRTLTVSNNGPNVVLTWNISRGHPLRNQRYGEGPPPDPEDPPPPPPATLANPPTNLSGTVIGMNQINFTWTDNSSNETDFVFQMLADDGVTWVSIATVAANVTTFSLSNIASGKTYNFRVLAHGEAGYSDPSNATTVTTPLSDVFTVTTASTASKRTRPSFIGANTVVAPPLTATS